MQRHSTRTRGFHRPRRERGQALVEFSMMLPILMLLVCGIVELGDALNSYLTVVNAARDGARIGSKGLITDTDITNLVLTDMGRLRDVPTSGDVTIVHGTLGPNPTIRVQACTSHRLLVNYPLLPLPDPMRMCSATTIRSKF